MDPIARGNPGAQFRKADLHVHTPGSYDYKKDGLTEKDLVDHFIANDLELVVAADHNCMGWYENLRKEAESREEPLEVLPGVEITTPQGGDNQIHLVAIFPPEKANQVNLLLGAIEIDPSSPSSTQANPRIPSICDEIQSRGGLAVLAHIDDHSGAHTETESGNIRNKIFDTDLVAAIEVVCESSRKEYPEFPTIKSSDAHAPDELGRGFTYLKMTSPSFEGLQTALSDPESRIRFSLPEYNHGHITGIRFEGEFFDGRAIKVSENLNCLIGGKGTGKSTVIEQIRYAFDIPPQATRIEHDYQDLVRETLGEEGEIEVQVKTSTGEEYSIRRSYSERPEIIRANGDQTGMHVDTFKSKFLDLEIHSQGELLEVARDTNDQLDLIDSYLEFDGEKATREEIKDNLRTNAQNLQSLHDKIDRIDNEIRDYEAIEENLDLMEEGGVEDVLNDQKLWDEERSFLNQIEEATSNIRDEIPEEDDLPEPPQKDFDESPNQDLLDETETYFNTSLSAVSSQLELIHEELDDLESSVETKVSEWGQRDDERQEEFKEIADEIEDETDVDIEEYFELKEEAEKLGDLKKSREGVIDEIEEVERERRRLLSELRACRANITDTRREGVQNISNELNNIRVRLEPNGNRESYTEWFDNVLKGSNAGTSFKRKVTEEYGPLVLFDIIRKWGSERLKNNIGLTETTVQNIIGFDQLRNQLHELQIQELHDKPVIELQHQGVWKPLKKMSDGQKCTALLSIALLERDKPLIIDQPEDMLDNEYIYDEVVKMTKEVKEARQIISATHNANMPVLGDAEKINVMHSDGIQGYIHQRGSIDDPEVRKSAKEILEGGDEAFSLRTQKYGALQII